jgi:hypothetical protein
MDITLQDAWTARTRCIVITAQPHLAVLGIVRVALLQGSETSSSRVWVWGLTT